jgi:hypothetical protein
MTLRRTAVAACLVLASAAALAAQTSVDALLIDNERRSWELVKQKDWAALEGLIADDYYDVFANGKVIGKREFVDVYIRGVDLISYSLSDFHVVRLSEDAAIVVYTARARGVEKQIKSRNAKGPVETRAAVTSAWARRDGKWVNVFYRENDLK